MGCGVGCWVVGVGVCGGEGGCVSGEPLSYFFRDGFCFVVVVVVVEDFNLG